MAGTSVSSSVSVCGSAWVHGRVGGASSSAYTGLNALIVAYVCGGYNTHQQSCLAYLRISHLYDRLQHF
jgi:hypothetical protein